jgi:hypothetical protein
MLSGNLHGLERNEFPTGRLVSELIARKSVMVLQAKNMAVIGCDRL